MVPSSWQIVIAGLGQTGSHEDFHDPAAQPVRDIVIHERAAGGVFGGGEEPRSAAHLVDHDRELIALVGETVDFGAFGHDQGVTHGRDPVREMTARVLLDEAGDDIGSEGVDVGAHRGVMDRVHRAFPEDPVRFALSVIVDLATPGIRRVAVDPDQRHRRRIGVAGVIGRIHHTDRVVRRDLVQLRALQSTVLADDPGRVAQAPDPLAGGTAGGSRGDRVEHGLFAGQRGNPAIDRAGLEGRHREVVVWIAEAGHEGASAQVDVGHVGSDRSAYFLAVANGDDPAVAHGDTGGDPVERINRQHASAGEYELPWLSPLI